MATAQEVRGNLTKRSVHSAVLNPVGSKAYLKKIIPIAISSILQQRVEFEVSDFETRNYGGVQYQRFKSKVKDPILNRIKYWINGALDALDKNYLRELFLIFENRESLGQVDESYKFQFKYMGTDVIPLEEQQTTKRNLDEATNVLLTSIASLNSHKPFKMDSIKIKMAISYYEDVTPPMYRPPYFETEKENSALLRDALAMQPSAYISLGVLRTGYHIVKCRGKGEAFSMNVSNSTLSTSFANTVEQQQNLSETPEGSGSKLAAIKEVEESKSSQNGTTSEIECIDLCTNSLTESDVESCEESFTCICKIFTRIQLIDTVMCSKCCTYQHCACVGYLQGNDMPDSYVCPQCKDGDLTPERLDRRYKLALFKLTTGVAYFTRQIPNDLLRMFSTDMKYFVYEKLKHLQVIEDTVGVIKLNMKKMKKVLRGLFSQKTNSQDRKRKAVPDSMYLEDAEESQANSTVLGGNIYMKKLRDA